MHQRQRLDGGEIDGDVVGLHVEADHQHVGVGQQEEEALDQEDRQRHDEPQAQIDLARARRSALRSVRAGDADKLPERRQVGREHGRDQCGDRVGRITRDKGRAHEAPGSGLAARGRSATAQKNAQVCARDTPCSRSESAIIGRQMKPSTKGTT